MGLIKIGVAYLSKSGKYVLVKIKMHYQKCNVYLVLNREDLKQILDSKRYETDVLLIKS